MMPFIATAVRTFFERYAPLPAPLAGSPRALCAAIVERLWGGAFYRMGLGHFDYVWMRDFGVVARALMATGNAKRAQDTLQWVLRHYERAGRVATCVDARGRLFDAPRYALDTLPWLFDALVVCRAELSHPQRQFLQAQLTRYCAQVLTREGLVRPARFAELRDAVVYRQSAYGVCMLELLKRAAQALGLEAPALSRQDYPALLQKEYWNGAYFNADKGTRAFSAECSLFPFWLGIIQDRGQLAALLRTIRQKGLAEPYPMRYTDEPRAFAYRWWATLIMPNYAATTIWSWMGALYLDLLARAGDPTYAQEYEKFSGMLARAGTFPELLNPDGSRYQSAFYRAEHGMLWAVLYLVLPDPA
jgi:hypothetical protein